LLAAAALLVDPRAAQVGLLDRVDDEVHEVILRHPVVQARGQQHRSVSATVTKRAGMRASTHQPGRCSFFTHISPIGRSPLV